MPRWQFDFSTSSIDVSLFPARTWAGITREVLSDGAGFLNHGQGQGDFELREAIARHAREHRGVRAYAWPLIVGACIDYLLFLAPLLTGQGLAVQYPGRSDECR